MHTARAAVLELLEVELKPCCLVKAQRNARSPVRVVVFSGWITDGQSTFQPRRAQTPSQLDVDAVDVHVRRRLGGGGGGSGRVRRPPVRLEELGQVLARLLELVLVQDNVEHLLSPGHTSSHCFTSVLRQFSTISVLSLNVKSKPHLYSTLL